MSGSMTQADTTPDKRSADLRAEIDENLKRVYQAALDEAVPDRFTKLIEQLRQRDLAR